MKKKTEKELVFVYGTLMAGYHNHYYLETSKWVDYAKTVKDYSLFESGIPFVYEDLNITTITGEVYEVSKSVMYYLDMLEGHPDAYKRKQIDVKLGFTNEVVKAWIYFYPRIVGNLIESGNYEEAYPRRKNKISNL